MTEPPSGLRLFLLYAFPCAEDRLNGGRITRRDFEKLRWLIEHKKEPEADLLERCFPAAIENYRKTCKEIGSLGDFSRESVAYYWRYSHGHSGDCAVNRGKVTELEKGGKGARRVRVEEENLHVSFCFNPYHLKLDIGYKVFVHRLWVIETDDAASR